MACVARPGDSAQREARAVELCVVVAKLGWRCCRRCDGVGANEGSEGAAI
jgi:hypothetical protein